MQSVSRSSVRKLILCLLVCAVIDALVSTSLSAETQGRGFVAARSELPDASDQGVKWALLIGIANYPSVQGFEIQQLKGPVKDVNALAELLKDPRRGGFDADHVFTLTDQEATRRRILMTLNDIARLAAREDMVIFYFSGHGTRDIRHDKTYLIPYDHDLRDPGTTCIDFDDLAEKIEDIEANKVVVILDACHSGGVRRKGEKGAGETGVAVRYKEAFREAFRGSEGRGVLLSSDKSEVSWETDEGGVFTRFLLEGLNGKADRGPKDGIVTFGEAARYVEEEVPKYTSANFPRSQRPTHDQGRFRGDIPLAINWPERSEFLQKQEREEFRQKQKALLDKRSGAILLAALEGLDQTLKEFSLRVADSLHRKALGGEEPTKQERLLGMEMDLLADGTITVGEYIRRARVIYKMREPSDMPGISTAPLRTSPKEEETIKEEVSEERTSKEETPIHVPAPVSASLLRFTAGLKAGVNFATFFGDYWEDTIFKMGFCGGGFAAVSFRDILAIQPEVLFTMKGTDEETDCIVELNYLEIPVLARLSIPVQFIRFSLFAGPAFAVKLSSRYMCEWGEEEIGYFTDIDLGLALGGGLDFDTGWGRPVIEVRYTMGLRSIKDEEGYDIRNGVISVMAGYSF